MGNEVSISQTDIQGSLVDLQARIRAGASVNKRMLFPNDTGPLPKGCKCTPLGYSILSGNLELLDTLIYAGVDVNKPVGLRDRFHFTPLQLAVAVGSGEAVRRLLERGADPNAALQSKRGTITLLQSSQHRHRPATAAIGSRPIGANTSSISPSASPLSLLVPEVLSSMRSGDTALHIAIDCAVEEHHHGVTSGSASGCRTKIVEALIAHPSTDLNRPNGRRRTPLYKACKRQLELVVTLLATHPRIDVNAGWPLFAAIKVQNLQLVRVLLQAGAGPTCGAYKIEGHTPLSYALRGRPSDSFYDRAGMVEMLVQAGSHVEPEMLSYAEERNWHAVLAALRFGAALGLSAEGPASGSGGRSGDGVVQPGPAMAEGHGTGALQLRASGTSRIQLSFLARFRHRLMRAHESYVSHKRSSHSRSWDDGVSGSIGGGAPAAAASTLATAARSGGGSGRLGNSVSAGGRGGGSSSRQRVSSTARIGTSVTPDGASARHRFGARSWTWRIRFPFPRAPSLQPQSQRLSEVVLKNPIVILFAPLLIPILIFEPIFLAFGEIFKVLAIVLVFLAVVVVPALLYGVYRLSRGLVRLLYNNRRLQNSSLVPFEPSSETSDAPAQSLPSFHQTTASISQLLVPQDSLSGAATAAAAGVDAVDRGSSGRQTVIENVNAVIVGLSRESNNRTGAAADPITNGSELLQPAKLKDSYFNLPASSSLPSSVPPPPPEALDGLAESTFRLRPQHLAQQLPGAGLGASPSGVSSSDTAAPPAAASTSAVGGVNFCSELTSSSSTGGSTVGAGGAAASGVTFSGVTSGSGSSAGGYTAVCSNHSSDSFVRDNAFSTVSSFLSGDIELAELLWRLGLEICVVLSVVTLTVIAVTYLDAFLEFHLARFLPTDSMLQICMRGRGTDRFRYPQGSLATCFSRKERTFLARLFFGTLVVRWISGAPAWVLTGLVAVVWLGCLLKALCDDYRLMCGLRVLEMTHASQGGSDSRSLGSEVAVGNGAQPESQPTAGPRNGGAPLSGVAGTHTDVVTGAEAAATAAPEGCTSTRNVTDGLDGLCCVCMSNRAVMGFVHRSVVHCCLCEECEGVLRGRHAIANCLICKHPASVVAKVIVT
ncbi:hypothetical protein VaNZ11_016263 [Volvox africanus]|uniref:ANK_REP_REGION domain-containing protein n=1 Tax=Volvox africanus TaxID=51714 RepID=A0ABQ5SMF6_9CHLO|nr:hypothetical protein VaNZ11_016263 [Volvox africanus]